MSAFQKIGSDRLLQDHWLRRLIAGIIDSIIIWVITTIILALAAIPTILFGVVPAFIGTSAFLQGVLFFLYAWFMEFSRGATLGKQIMNLKVTTTQGSLPSPDKALLINISKIHWVLWLVDTLVGMALPGDPHQKYSDRWVGTTVVSTIDRTLILPASPSASTSTLSPTPPSPPSPPSNA
jgi:uncharacterized RDD family membrane protein YckC